MRRFLTALNRPLPWVALLLALPLISACSAVGGVVTSNSTLHQARTAIYKGDLNAGINLYRLVLEDSRDSSEDAAESRFHIALVRMSSDPTLTDLGEARQMLLANQDQRRAYKTLEVATWLGVLERIGMQGDNASGLHGQIAALEGRITTLQAELVKKDETLRKVNAAIGAR